MIDTTDERPVFYDVPGAYLAGVLTVPRRPNGMTVMLPWGGGAYPSSGKNRIRTTLARALADEGYHAFRFDYQGLGESGGHYAYPDLTTPYIADVVATGRWLVSQGLDRIIAVGSCFGAYSTLLSVTELPQLEGLVMVRSPVRRDHKEVKWAQRSWRDWAQAATRFRLQYLTDARQRAKYRRIISAKVMSAIPGRIAPAPAESIFSRNLRYLLERRVPVLFLYSGDDDFHRDLVDELSKGLHRMFDAAGPTTGVIVTEERLQGYATLAAQQFLVTEVLTWLRNVCGTPEPDARQVAHAGLGAVVREVSTEEG